MIAEARHQEVLKNYYVICAVTGAKIRLDELRYWDVPKQECYASTNVVPGNQTLSDGSRIG